MKLELCDVTCGYFPAKPVIKNINMTLADGDICCILGPNGVGKSTLFKTILNLIKPLAGKICIDGEDIRDWKPKKMSEYVAYVAQSHIPAFPYKVREIAMMGRMGQTGVASSPSKADYEIVEQALETVGIRHLRDSVYTDISGGERQLLMIARALAQKPRILIMDEPTANLDYGNMVRVIKTMRQLGEEGLCVIFTSHMPDQAFMTGAKTALLLRNAPMIFGSAEKVITEKNLDAAYETDIQILEIIGEGGHPVRVASPRFR